MRKWNYCVAFILFACLSFSKAAVAYGEVDKTNGVSVYSIEQNKEAVLEGKVTDKDGIELPGVSVLLEGTTYGTVTDIDGHYHFKLPDKKGQRIIYSFVGMKTQVYTYTGAAIHNVVLESDDIALDDVVVIGYGSKNKKSLTSSIASMDKKEMERLSATSVTMDNMLAGTIKGVLATTTSGEPGAAIKISVRGITSPYPNMVTGQDNNMPLYVIDGVPMFMESNSLNPLMNIAPSDIESIDVLKDAAATAIYGSRGANGVIIVKTKGGRKGEKVSVEAGYTFSVGNPVKNYDPLNTSEFKSLQNTILKNTVNAANMGMSDAMYYTDIMQMYGKVGVQYDDYYNPISLSYDGPDDSLYGKANTDWAQEVRNKNAATHQYNVAVRGGSEKTNYSFSFNGLNQEGLLLNDKLERYGGRLSLDTEINKYISMGATLNYSYSNRKSGSQEAFMGETSGTWQARPDVAVRDDNGNFNWLDVSAANYGGGGVYIYDANPVAQLQRKAEYVNDQFLGNAYAEFTPLKGLKLRADINISRYAFKSSYFNPTKTQLKTEMPDFGLVEMTPSSLSTYDSRVTTTSINFRADYNLNIDKHAITVMAGYGGDRYWMNSNSNMYQGFPNDEVLNNPGSASLVLLYSDSYSRSGLNSVYGRATYDYDSRYLVEASLRADASSKFAPANQWGVFPAVSLGWRINNEKFLKGINQIDDLKLRLSWGKTGSTNVADFSYKQFFLGSDKYMGNSSITLQDLLPNTGVRWEMTTEYNAGLDFSFFNNRLTGSLDVYHRYTDGALTPAPHILESGFTNYYDNIIDMTNNGVEFNIGGDIIRNKDFRWNTNFNIAANRNKIKRLNGASISTYMQDAYIEGMPAGTLKGYKVKGICQDLSELEALDAKSPTGIYQSNTGVGDYIMEDTDGNGMIDTYDRVVIANPEPKCFGGWLNTLTYKDLSLSFLFQYQCGGEALYSNLLGDMTGSLGQSVLRELYGNTWSPDNRDAHYAQLVFMGYNSYNYTASDRYVFKTSYLRMKNITLSYNLPQALTTKWGVKNASVFATVTNLFTITDWPGLDPEAIGTVVTQMSSSTDPYPMSRTFSLGLKVQF
jgi:TonB-linked SusC/RagA family outer membrane protein